LDAVAVDVNKLELYEHFDLEILYRGGGVVGS
jgi:hypothetical protein